MHPTYRGLAFLLSLGSLPIACNKDSDEPTGDTKTGGPGTDGSSGDSPTSTTASAPTGTGTTAGEGTGTGTSGEADTSTGGTDSSATEPAVTGFITTHTDTGNTDESGDPPPPPPPENPICQAYLEHLNECYPRYARYNAYYALYCDTYLQYGRRDGQGCIDAMEAYFACFNAIPCGMLGPESCDAEFNAIADACPSFGGGEETGGSSGGSSGGESSSSTGP